MSKTRNQNPREMDVSNIRNAASVSAVAAKRRFAVAAAAGLLALGAVPKAKGQEPPPRAEVPELEEPSSKPAPQPAPAAAEKPSDSSTASASASVSTDTGVSGTQSGTEPSGFDTARALRFNSPFPDYQRLLAFPDSEVERSAIPSQNAEFQLNRRAVSVLHGNASVQLPVHDTQTHSLTLDAGIFGELLEVNSAMVIEGQEKPINLTSSSPDGSQVGLSFALRYMNQKNPWEFTGRISPLFGSYFIPYKFNNEVIPDKSNGKGKMWFAMPWSIDVGQRTGGLRLESFGFGTYNGNPAQASRIHLLGSANAKGFKGILGPTLQYMNDKTGSGSTVGFFDSLNPGAEIYLGYLPSSLRPVALGIGADYTYRQHSEVQGGSVYLQTDVLFDRGGSTSERNSKLSARLGGVYEWGGEEIARLPPAVMLSVSFSTFSPTPYSFPAAKKKSTSESAAPATTAPAKKTEQPKETTGTVDPWADVENAPSVEGGEEKKPPEKPAEKPADAGEISF